MHPTEIYAIFTKKAGSSDIAGIATIEALADFCRKNKPHHILELGGGIGTLSFTMLKNCDGVADIYEQNDFCRNALNENLSEFTGRFSILTDYLHLPPKREYDVIVIDGGKGKGGGEDGGFPQAIAAYINSLSSVKTIFIEGQRKSQRFWATEALRTRFLYTPQKYPDPNGGKKGCLRIDCVPCAQEYKRLLNHYYWRKKIY